MSTPDTIDLAALLAPIPGDHPGGQSVMFEGPHDEIKTARQSGDRSQVDATAKEADWAGVVRVATKVLTERSKDLQVAAWMTEALTHLHGFAGLRDGLRLQVGLLNGFWEGAFPAIDDGDLAFRASPFVWLNSSSDSRSAFTPREGVLKVPLTDAVAGPAYHWLDWKESRDMEQLALQNPQRYAAAVAEGRITGEQFDKAVAGCRRAFYERVHGDIAAAYDECARLQAVLRDKFGADAPSIMQFLQAIEECRDVIERIVKEKRVLEPDPSDAAADVPADGGAAAPAPRVVASSGGIDPVDRADALRRLAAVSAFFKRTEPHSPVAYLVERAIKWGNMPLEAWLREVISSDDVLNRLKETLGITEPK